MFKIVSEGSSGAGVRRIEAVTGHGAVAHVNETEEMVKGLAVSLKCRVADVPARLEALQAELKAAQKKAEELAGEIAKAQVSDVADKVKDVKGVARWHKRLTLTAWTLGVIWATKCVTRLAV